MIQLSGGSVMIQKEKNYSQDFTANASGPGRLYGKILDSLTGIGHPV
jgi:hypothetical protein